MRRRVLREVLVDDAVRGREEREDRRDEVALLVVELLLPVLHVVAEVDLFRRPKRSFCFLVHGPDLCGNQPVCWVHRIDGVEVDAKIQHERAVKF